MFSKSKRTLGLILAGLTVATAFVGCTSGGDTDPTEATTADGGGDTPTVEAYSVDDMLSDATIAMGEEDNVSLKVWAPQVAVEVFQAQCDEFSAAMKDLGKTVDIEVIVTGEGDAATAIKNAPEDSADVFGFASDQGMSLFSGKFTAPVRLNYAQAIKDENLSDSIDTLLYQGDGDPEELLYAYPSTGDNGYILYYDKSVLSEDDVKTLEGLVAACEEADKNLAMDMGDGFYGCMIPFTGGGTLSMQDDLITQKLNYDYDKIEPVAMAFSEVLSTSKNFKSENTSQLLVSGFKNGTHAAGVCGTWIGANVKEALGENMGAVKLPTINVDGEDTQIVSLFGYKNLGVNSKSESPLTAQSLAYYLSSEDCQKERFEEIGWGPSITSLVESEEVQNDTILNAIYAQQEFSLPQKDIATTWWSPTGTFSGYCVDSTKDHSEAEMKKQYDLMVEAVEAG